ncbi:MAG: PucR family transcriptional regulator, partial [Jiangellaceae bacterium]
MTMGDPGTSDRHAVAMSDLPFGDLFALASALADLVGAPVTIEDRDTAVLAYSDGQISVDDARIATILGRRVPQHYRDALQRAGVFQRIASESGVVYIDLPDSGMKPRAIVGVRAHGELLGSVWAALSGPPTAEQERALIDAAPVVAAHLLHDRSRRDIRRQTRTELVTDLLRGGAEAVEAAERLRLPAGGVVVAALTPAVGVAVNGHRMADALALYLSAVEPHSVSAVVGSAVYCILRTDQAGARRIVADFLTRAAERDQ